MFASCPSSVVAQLAGVADEGEVPVLGIGEFDQAVQHAIRRPQQQRDFADPLRGAPTGGP